ncbi:MAG: pyridoxal phosphate-dependent aminotransferase [Bryobacteraceae bacterium]
MFFSSRTPGDYRPNRLNEALAARRAGGGRVLDLTLTNPTRAGLSYPGQAILEALEDPRSLTYDPTPRGFGEAREAVTAYHAARGQRAEPDRLLLTGSTSEAYGWLFKLLCEPGDEVLAPRPSYPLFECLAVLDAVRIVEYPLAEELRWGLDLEALERCRTARTRAVVLVNPNNPTGAYLRREDWLRLQTWAAPRGLAIIADEVFFEYDWQQRQDRVSSFDATGEALVFTLSGLSKAAGLPQMKLGWIHASGPRQLLSEALERLEWIADAYLPVSAPIQHAAPAWFKLLPEIQEMIRSRCLENLATARGAFSAAGGARALEPEGGWSVVLDVPRLRTEEEWALRLLEGEGVLVQPGFFYDFEREAFLVASLLCEPGEFRKGLARIEKALHGSG